MAYDVARDYRGGVEDETQPGRDAWVIASNAADQAKYPRCLFLNTAGVVTGIPIMAGEADTVVSFTFAAGWQPMGFRRITACPANTIGVI